MAIEFDIAVITMLVVVAAGCDSLLSSLALLLSCLWLCCRVTVGCQVWYCCCNICGCDSRVTDGCQAWHYCYNVCAYDSMMTVGCQVWRCCCHVSGCDSRVWQPIVELVTTAIISVVVTAGCDSQLSCLALLLSCLWLWQQDHRQLSNLALLLLDLYLWLWQRGVTVSSQAWHWHCSICGYDNIVWQLVCHQSCHGCGSDRRAAVTVLFSASNRRSTTV